MKEKIERNGIRHDHLAKMFNCSQAHFSMCVNGLRTMPDEMRYILDYYLDKIEEVNMNFHTEYINLLFKDVFEAVEDVLGITEEQIKDKSREPYYVRAREMFAFHAYNPKRNNLLMIAKAEGRVNHSTIINQLINHSKFYNSEKDYKEQSDRIKMLLDAKKV